MKGNAVKVRKLYQDKVIAGFAGSTADAFTLFEKFEDALEKYHGQLTRAAVELAKEWRSDRALRKLEAMLIVVDKSATLLISGNGDVELRVLCAGATPRGRFNTRAALQAFLQLLRAILIPEARRDAPPNGGHCGFREKFPFGEFLGVLK